MYEKNLKKSPLGSITSAQPFGKAIYIIDHNYQLTSWDDKWVHKQIFENVCAKNTKCQSQGYSKLEVTQKYWEIGKYQKIP